VIGIAVDFNLQITKLYFYNIVDLIADLGGISAAAKPVFDIITPMIMLYFFYSVASIIRESYKIDYKDQLQVSLKTFQSHLCREQLQDFENVENTLKD
jgi:hypothetical protein